MAQIGKSGTNWQNGNSKIFGKMAKYFAKWQNIWRNGKIFGEIAKYLAKWQNIWRNGKIFGEMAKYFAKWQKLANVLAKLYIYM
jgi:hypothetical protein